MYIILYYHIIFDNKYILSNQQSIDKNRNVSGNFDISYFIIYEVSKMTNCGILVSPQDRQIFAVRTRTVIYARAYDCRIDKCVDIISLYLLVFRY